MYEIYEQLLQKHGVTNYRVSLDTGIAQSVLSAWKNGVSTPKTDKLRVLAKYFGVSLNYLMTGEENTEIDDEIYYFDDDARDIAEFLHKNPKYKVLFDASRKVKPEDIEFVKQMIDRVGSSND